MNNVEYWKGFFDNGSIVEYYRVYLDFNNYDYLHLTTGLWTKAEGTWNERHHATKLVRCGVTFPTDGLFYIF